MVQIHGVSHIICGLILEVYIMVYLDLYKGIILIYVQILLKIYSSIKDITYTLEL